MEEEKQYWSMDELLSLTDKVQEIEVEYGEKFLKVQWCELTESEEPKMIMPDESLPEEEASPICPVQGGGRKIKRKKYKTLRKRKTNRKLRKTIRLR